MEMVQHEHLKSQGLCQKAALFAGHSLGEYAALGARSTFMAFEKLLTLIFYRGLKMQNALQRDKNGRTDYSMMAADPSRVGKGTIAYNRLSLEANGAVGFDEASLQSVVKLISEETKLLLEIVNYNVRSQQYVCAGHYRALWLLGKLCDDLAAMPEIHTLTLQDLQHLIVQHMATAETLTNETTLHRGRATIPLSGIDIPFHSTMLRGEITDYRAYLRSMVSVSDINTDELVDKWVPNVVGKPFSLDRQYVKHVQRVTQSKPLGELLDTMG